MEIQAQVFLNIPISWLTGLIVFEHQVSAGEDTSALLKFSDAVLRVHAAHIWVFVRQRQVRVQRFDILLCQKRWICASVHSIPVVDTQSSYLYKCMASALGVDKADI